MPGAQSRAQELPGLQCMETGRRRGEGRRGTVVNKRFLTLDESRHIQNGALQDVEYRERVNV